MSYNFRKSFELIHRKAIQWFPGHMTKGLRQMQQKLKSVDCIIEVHDARIPYTGRNRNFKHTISGLKPHILVLNKQDLVDKKLIRKIAEQIKVEDGIDHVLYTNCKNDLCSGSRKVLPLACEMIADSNRFNRAEEKNYNIMVIGVPNVGKSSLLNVLRNRHLKKKKASPVGAIAGITRSVLSRIKISDDPLVYMFDTPGILEPNISSMESGMKLALCSCLPDHLVGTELIADYLLYWLNKHENFKYMELMNVEKPTDDILEVLVAGSQKLNKVVKLKNFNGDLVLKPDLNSAATFMIKSFRTGYFGKINLDIDDIG